MRRYFAFAITVILLFLLLTACGKKGALDIVDTPTDMSADTSVPTQTPLAVEIPLVTAAPTVTPVSAEPTPMPTETPNPKPLEGKIIGIDPGHQSKGNHETEPVRPDSSDMKAKCSSGTRVPGGMHEYAVNLEVGLRVQAQLLEWGATVVMTRESNDVDISNIERAQTFNAANTDYALRLHCNGTNNAAKAGAFILVPYTNPYKEDCQRAAQLLLDAYCAATGAANLGLTERNDQTGFNWCERMIINIEMGHMTNPEEGERLSDPAYWDLMAAGICEGILLYFNAEAEL